MNNVNRYSSLGAGEKLDDYVKARYKRNQQLTIMKLTTDTGGMNPEMSSVDFIQDGDLNKSLKHFVSFRLKLSGQRPFDSRPKLT